MKRGHIAIASSQTNGHVYPMLPLCSELVRRGYRVTCPTNDLYAEAVRCTGASPVLLEGAPVPMNEDVKREIAALFARPFNDSQWLFGPELIWQYQRDSLKWWTDAALRAYSSDVPDLVLYDRYLPPGRILANSLSRPAILMSAHFARYKGLYTRQNGVCRTPDGYSQASGRLDEFLDQYGVPGEDGLSHTEELNIHFIPREFQYHNDWFDDHYCFAGPSLNRSFHRAWTKRGGDDPVVLISSASFLHGIGINSIDNYFQLFVEALGNSEFHCVLSVGREIGEIDKKLKNLPANFEINRTVSHLEILPHASVSVCHGGMRSILEATCNEVPVIAIPIHPNAEEVSYRAVELGLGMLLEHERLTVATVREAIASTVEDRRLRERIKEMARIFNAPGGESAAADAVERFIKC